MQIYSSCLLLLSKMATTSSSAVDDRWIDRQVFVPMHCLNAVQEADDEADMNLRFFVCIASETYPISDAK